MNSEKPFRKTHIYHVVLSKNKPLTDLKGREGRPRPNSFNLMQFLGNFGKIICFRPPVGLAPPPRGNLASATVN